MQHVGGTVVFTSLILHLVTLSGGRPLGKRTVSEVQLMHDLGQHQQVQQRRQWLQTRLQGLRIPRGREESRLTGLGALTGEEIQEALEVLEKLLHMKHP